VPAAGFLLWHVPADFPGTAGTQPGTYGSAVSKGSKRRCHPSLSPLAVRSEQLCTSGAWGEGARPQPSHPARQPEASSTRVLPGKPRTLRQPRCPRHPLATAARRLGSCRTPNLLPLAATTGRITGWEF